MTTTIPVSVPVSLIDKVTTPLRGVLRPVDKLGKNIAKTRNELTKLGGVKSDIEHFRKLKTTTGKTASELAAARAKLSDLGKSLSKTEKPSKKLRGEFNRQKREVQRLQDSHEAEAETLNKLRDRLASSGVSTKKLASASRDLNRDIRRTNAVLDRQADKLKVVEQARAKVARAAERMQRRLQTAANLSLIGDGAARTATRVRQSLGSMVGDAISFESAMADVRKVVTFDTPDGFKKFGELIREMSREVPISAEGLANIAAAGGQLGIAARELPDFVGTVARMSTAFDMLPDVAGEAMAKLSNVYQIPIGEMESLGDAINHLSDNTAAKASDIVRAMGRVGGTAKQFGLSAVQVAALTDAFIALGKPPEVAGTAINAMLLKMQTATKQNAKFGAGLRAIGVDARDLEKAIATDAQGALTSFLQKLEQIDAQDRAGVLSDLFGLEYSDDIGLLVGSLDEYRKALGLVADAEQFAGSMGREFANRAETAANGGTLLKSKISELAGTIGQQLLPELKQLMKDIGGVVVSLTEWVKENPALTKTIVTLVAAIGGIATVMTPVFMTASALVGAWGVMSFGVVKISALLTTLGATVLPMVGTAVAALGKIIIANPIGAAVAAIGTAAYLVYQHWEPISGFFGDLWSGITATARAAWGGVVSMFDGIWGGLKDNAKAAWEGIKALFLNYTPAGILIKHWDGVSERFQGIGGDILKGLGQGMVSGAVEVVNTISDIGSSIISEFKSVLGIASPSKVFQDFGNFLMEGLIAGLIEKIANLKETVLSIGADIGNWFKEQLGISSPSRVFEEFGSFIMDGLIGGITAKVAALKDKVLSLGADIGGWFKEQLGIKSPSRVFMSLGGYLSQGLALGITSGEGDIIKRMDRIRSAITEPLKAVAGPPDPQRLSRAAGSAFAAAAALPLGAGEAAASGPQIVFQPSYSISVSVGDGSPASAVDIQGAVRAALAEHDEEMKAEMRRLLND